MLRWLAVKTNKDEALYLRVDKPFFERLRRAADVADRSMSQIVREAVKEKLDVLARKHPELRIR